MSKLFGFGMTVPEAIARATVNAARTFDVFRDRGTLNVGAVADVTYAEASLQEALFFVRNGRCSEAAAPALAARARAERSQPRAAGWDALVNAR